MVELKGVHLVLFGIFGGRTAESVGSCRAVPLNLEHSPTSQTVGEVGKDGKVGKRVRGVECGCDVRLQPRAAELHSRRGLAGAGRVGDIIKNKKTNPRKSLCFGINLGSMLPWSHGDGGRKASLEPGMSSLSPPQGLCCGKSRRKRDFVSELTWGWV